MPPKRVSLHTRTTQDATDLPSSSSTEESPLWGSARREHVVVDLELREIMPNRHQPRTNPAEANLDELAESIRTHGVIQPVIVRSIPLTKYDGTGRHYELIAGERRWRASALAGRETIPALIRAEDADPRTMRELALIENIQRQDLHPLDEAMAFAQLKEDLGYSYRDIATQIGKSKSYVTNRMRLLHLDDDLRALVAARPDTIKHVYELARIPDAALRAALVAAVRDDDLSRTATSAHVDALLGGGFFPESVSQDTDCDTLHTLLAPESVSQDTERDTLHNVIAPKILDRRLSRDIHTIEQILHRWEAYTAPDHGNSRAALVQIIATLNTHLNRIAHVILSEPDRSAPHPLGESVPPYTAE